MAYSKYFYNRVNWKNKSESLETPLGQSNLNRMDSGIYQLAENLDVAYTELEVKKLNASSATKMLSEMPTWDSDTGILTFKFYDGTEFSVDFNVEKIPVSFSMDSAGVITMTTEDGTEWTADIGELIPDYTFLDSEQITFTKTKNEDGSYTVTANLVKGSITADYLQPDYLADVTKQASSAAASAQSASQSADNAAYDAKLAQSYSIGGSTIREGEDEDNAKYYSQKAKEYADKASEIVGGDFIPNSAKGIAGGVATLDDNLAVSKAVADGEGNNIEETYATKEQLENHELDFELLASDGETLVTSDNDNLLAKEDLHQDTSKFLTQDDIDSGLSDTSVHAVQNRVVTKALAKKFDASKVANNFTTTQEGFVADARTVKTLNDNISLINDNLISSNNTDYAYIHTFEQGGSGFVTLVPKKSRKECAWLLFDAFPTENSLTRDGSYTISLINRAADTITIGGGKIAATRIDSTDTDGSGYTGKVKFAANVWRKGMILCSTPFCIRFSDD